MNVGRRSRVCSRLLTVDWHLSYGLSRSSPRHPWHLASRLTSPRSRIIASALHTRTGSLVSSLFSLWSRHNSLTLKSSSVNDEEDPAKYKSGGYHPVHVGEIFNGRYKVISKLGYGVYSTVWLAEDLTQSRKYAGLAKDQSKQRSQPPRYVAVKILTADSYGSSQSVFEREILQHISKTHISHAGYRHVVHLLDSFVHSGPNGDHVCLVTEPLGPSVMSYQQSLPKKQLPKRIAQQIARQTLCALDWLHESCGIIHTDIKPSNMLIEIPNAQEVIQSNLERAEEHNSDGSEDSRLKSRPISYDYPSEDAEIAIKIIDFGVASWKDKHLTEWIQPTSLRAPEVFLGSPWDSSVEVWNFACVIYELLQGRVLFRGRSGPDGTWSAEEDQLAQMIELFGPIPASVRDTGKFSSEYFDKDGNLMNIKHMYPSSLQELFQHTPNVSMSAHDYLQLEAFLRAMLQYDPAIRKTPTELLKEPWLHGPA